MTSPLALKTAAKANHDVGLREAPPGSNRHPRIDHALDYVGVPHGNAYCAALCSLWVHEAAVELNVTPKFRKSGSAMGLVTNNPSLVFHTLTAADVPIIGINEHADHIHGHAFLIVGFDEATGALTTIDPNSDPGGSREGLGVFLLQRRNVRDPERVGYLAIR